METYFDLFFVTYNSILLIQSHKVFYALDMGYETSHSVKMLHTFYSVYVNILHCLKHIDINIQPIKTYQLFPNCTG